MSKLPIAGPFGPRVCLQLYHISRENANGISLHFPVDNRPESGYNQNEKRTYVRIILQKEMGA